MYRSNSTSPKAKKSTRANIKGNNFQIEVDDFLLKKLRHLSYRLGVVRDSLSKIERQLAAELTAEKKRVLAQQAFLLRKEIKKIDDARAEAMYSWDQEGVEEYFLHSRPFFNNLHSSAVSVSDKDAAVPAGEAEVPPSQLITVLKPGGTIVSSDPDLVAKIAGKEALSEAETSKTKAELEKNLQAKEGQIKIVIEKINYFKAKLGRRLAIESKSEEDQAEIEKIKKILKFFRSRLKSLWGEVLAIRTERAKLDNDMLI